VKKVDMCELMPENRKILQNKGYEIQWGDFLDVNEDWKYDKIIANPPFTKNQDIDHVLKMYKHLNPGGRIVTIMSTTWLEGSQKKQGAFKEWLTEVCASYEVIKEGAFKKSGTGIKTVMVVIDKK
jgi:16S rRNA G1207 methylase RsmC